MLIDYWGHLKLSSHAEADILTSEHSNECTLGLENMWVVRNVLLVCMMYIPVIHSIQPLSSSRKIQLPIS